MACLITLWIVSCEAQNILIFMKSSFCFFYYLCLWCQIQEIIARFYFEGAVGRFGCQVGLGWERQREVGGSGYLQGFRPEGLELPTTGVGRVRGRNQEMSFGRVKLEVPA